MGNPKSGAVATTRETPSDREVVFTRILNAPRELVWTVWSDPEHLQHWFGPLGFAITTQEFSFTPGGVWRLIMHGPDGTDYPTRIVFREIVPPSLLVYDNAWDLPGAPVDFTLVATFVADGPKTRLTMQLIFPSAASFQIGVERYGVLEGGTGTLERLAEYVTQLRE